MSAHSKNPYITPSMGFSSGEGVVRGRRVQQLTFTLRNANTLWRPLTIIFLCIFYITGMHCGIMVHHRRSHAPPTRLACQIGKCICASAQLYLCASVLLYLCTSVPLYICTFAPLCLCASVLLCLCAFVHLRLCVCVPQCPCAPVPVCVYPRVACTTVLRVPVFYVCPCATCAAFVCCVCCMSWFARVPVCMSATVFLRARVFLHSMGLHADVLFPVFSCLNFLMCDACVAVFVCAPSVPLCTASNA